MNHVHTDMIWSVSWILELEKIRSTRVKGVSRVCTAIEEDGYHSSSESEAYVPHSSHMQIILSVCILIIYVPNFHSV